LILYMTTENALMSRFRIHFLEGGIWTVTILAAKDDQSAREEFSRQRPGASIRGLRRVS
jgi:hypothetical protein